MRWRISIGRIDQDIGIKDERLFLVQYSIEFFSIRHINPKPSAVPGRELPRRIGFAFERRRHSQDTPQPRFHKGGHGGSPPSSLFFQLPHHGFVNIERCFHMESHIINVLICLFCRENKANPCAVSGSHHLFLARATTPARPPEAHGHAADSVPCSTSSDPSTLLRSENPLPGSNGNRRLRPAAPASGRPPPGSASGHRKGEDGTAARAKKAIPAHDRLVVLAFRKFANYLRQLECPLLLPVVNGRSGVGCAQVQPRLRRGLTR